MKWEVLADIDRVMTVAFYINNEIHTIISGDADFITEKLKEICKS